MKTERQAHTLRQATLFIFAYALILAVAGCGGGYGSPSGGSPAPSIASLTPASGAVGTSVTIYGANFGASQGTSTVTFGGTAATPTSWSATNIVVPVPAGAATGNVVVTVGGVAGSGMTFTVVPSAPAITAQPANQTVTAGQTAIFSVTATGTAPLSYQWKKNGSAITGATSTSYTTPAAAASDNGAQFTAVVSNTVGSVTSNAATLTVTTGTAKWPIKASANGRYFTDASGTPWFMVGDAAHHIVNVLVQSNWPTYFASRKAQGFNTVNIFSCSHGNCPPTGATADGQLPFTGSITSVCNGANRTDYDLATPNLAYWTELDSFINMAATYGLVVLFDPLTTADYLPDMRASGSTKANNFGAFLGNRYKSFPNIIWELGNDFQTWTQAGTTCPGTVSDNTLVQQLMAGIASTDPNHISTIQLDFYRSYSNQDSALDPYLKADGFYTYYETYDYALKAYNSTPVSPVFLTESNMEGANNTSHLCAPADGHILRRQMYWTMTSGAAGHVWGNTHVNHSDLTGTTWQSQLNTPATAQVALLTNLLNQFQWWKLVPDQVHQVVTAGFGIASPNTDNLCNSTYATTAWIPDSAVPSLASMAIVYTPVAATAPPLSVNMGMFSKPMTASWFDPTTGTSTPISGSPFVNSGSLSLPTPSAVHSDGTHDWVLVLQ